MLEYENEERISSYYCERIKSNYITIEYFTVNNYSLEEKNEYALDEKIENYMNNEFDFDKNDVIDIVKKIRELTTDLEEYTINIEIKNNTFCENVYYLNGYLESYRYDQTGLGNNISFYAGELGVDIIYKRNGLCLNGYQGTNAVTDDISKLYNKALKLAQLYKDNSKVEKHEDELKLSRKQK